MAKVATDGQQLDSFYTMLQGVSFDDFDLAPDSLVTGPDLGAGAVELLGKHRVSLVFTDDQPSHEHICNLAAEHRIDGLIVRHGLIDEAVMSASPRLRVIANHGAGYDNIDTDTAARLELPVFIAVGRNARSVAEHALTLILALHKSMLSFDRAVRSGHW